MLPVIIQIHSFFYIRTSNFDAEAERSYIFWRFEAETFLKMFLNLPGIVFQPISADVTDTVKALVSGHPRDGIKMSVTGAGRLREWFS